MAYKQVNYLLSNPQELISDNQLYPGNISDRINFGDSKDENNLYREIMAGITEDVKLNPGELDIDYIFRYSYWYYGRCRITPSMTRKQLPNIFRIDRIEQQENQINVYVSYFPYSEYKIIHNDPAKEKEIRAKYLELADLLCPLKIYKDDETTIIIEEMLKKYIELLKAGDYLPINSEDEHWQQQNTRKLNTLRFCVENELWGILTKISFDSNALSTCDFEKLRNSLIINFTIARQAMNDELADVCKYEMTSYNLPQDSSSPIDAAKSTIFETIYQKLTTFGFGTAESVTDWQHNDIQINTGFEKTPK